VLNVPTAASALNDRSVQTVRVPRLVMISIKARAGGGAVGDGGIEVAVERTRADVGRAHAKPQH
jgi:hypothetical protein